MTVSTKGGVFSPLEIERYKEYLMKKFPNCEITELHIEADVDDPDYVKLHYNIINKKEANKSFNRIRRISGYLGDVGRINNAKQHEIHDRVKHD